MERLGRAAEPDTHFVKPLESAANREAAPRAAPERNLGQGWSALGIEYGRLQPDHVAYIEVKLNLGPGGLRLNLRRLLGRLAGGHHRKGQGKDCEEMAIGHTVHHQAGGRGRLGS